MKNIFSVIARIRTPLALAALAFIVLYLVCRLILGLNIFVALTESNTFVLISTIINRLFILAIVALVLAVASYVYGQYLTSRSGTPPRSGPRVKVIDVSVENRKHNQK